MLTSMYGGYLGAGLGQIVLAALLIDGYDDFEVADASKNSIIAMISAASTAIYGFTDAVAWSSAILMGAGAVIGGFLGSLLTRSTSRKLLRRFVIMSGMLLTLHYFPSGTH